MRPEDVTAGWKADPSGVHEHRYWDGAAWTADVYDGDTHSLAPLDVPDDAPGSLARGLQLSGVGDAHGAEVELLRADQGEVDLARWSTESY